MGSKTLVIAFTDKTVPLNRIHKHHEHQMGHILVAFPEERKPIQLKSHKVNGLLTFSCDQAGFLRVRDHDVEPHHGAVGLRDGGPGLDTHLDHCRRLAVEPLQRRRQRRPIWVSDMPDVIRGQDLIDGGVLPAMLAVPPLVLERPAELHVMAEGPNVHLAAVPAALDGVLPHQLPQAPPH